MKPPLLIILTGLPCTGKTWLAAELSGALGLPLITKDGIKEQLFDSLGWQDREWSQKLGRATFDLLFHFLQIELRAGRSVMVEARFFHAYHLDRFQQMQSQHPFHPLVIELFAEGEILFQRFVRRSESGERHPGHVDHTGYAEAERLFRQAPSEPPFDLGGGYWAVDTSDFSRVDVNALAAALRAELDGRE